jgi:hypothetical protein
MSLKDKLARLFADENEENNMMAAALLFSLGEEDLVGFVRQMFEEYRALLLLNESLEERSAELRLMKAVQDGYERDTTPANRRVSSDEIPWKI